MQSIFFDLETTDKNFIGQILNYAFVRVDESFSIIDECCGLIQISRLQLPSPEAILANQTDVLEHQTRAADSERAAMRKILDYLERVAAEAGKERVPLIGYNSSRFDIPFLRTSMIRNGLNPYVGGRVLNRDLLFAARKLSMTKPEFPRAVGTKKRSEKDEKPRISLSLENLCHQFGMLKGAQAHESREDVLLTIELAKLFKTKFGLDVRRYDAFEALDSGTRASRGTVRWAAFPQYEPGVVPAYISAPMTLLDMDHRSSLWVDLARYGEGSGRRSISWFNHGGGSSFFVVDSPSLTPALQELQTRALTELKEVSLKNYFQTSNCDIEQDIYRLDFDAIDALRAAIWDGNEAGLGKLKNRDAKVVFLRRRLAEAELPLDARLQQSLKAYALYRYGGQAKVLKPDVETAYVPGVYHESFHQTFTEMMESLERLEKTAQGRDAALLRSLRTFYLRSEIYELCGKELLAIHRAMPAPVQAAS